MNDDVSEARQERSRELRRMPKDQLWRIYRQYMTPGSSGPIGEMMIAVILKHEFERELSNPERE
jgi:hypothetical protein